MVCAKTRKNSHTVESFKSE